MKFALAVHGTRGDVEPCAAIGVELQRRGHDVRMAVPPNLVGFVESAGLAAVAYGPDSYEMIAAQMDLARRLSRIQNPVGLLRAGKDLFVRGWADMSRTLTSIADGADLVFTGQIYHGVAANVAEYYDVPVAALHFFPVRVNGHVGLPALPSIAPFVRSTMKAVWWLYAQMTKDSEDAQRRELGLPPIADSASRRMEHGSLEIQAYDEVCFPGLAEEWGDRRPFVGALTMEVATANDDDVASWIAKGTPPIYFGFGSVPVESPADVFAMVTDVCAQLGERALICSGWADIDHIPHSDHVKVVEAVNHSAVFPVCRAVVHHGGAGTTAAGMRAGVPVLILWEGADQPIWATQVKRLKIGSGRRFTTTTRKSLAADLRSVCKPEYVAEAKQFARRMTTPAASVAAAADLLEKAARRQPRGAAMQSDGRG